jgi:hypothetical protein
MIFPFVGAADIRLESNKIVTHKIALYIAHTHAKCVLIKNCLMGDERMVKITQNFDFYKVHIPGCEL